MNIEEIIRLWHKTQRGHHLECKKAQLEFSDIMWELHGKLEKEKFSFPEQQCFGDEVI